MRSRSSAVRLLIRYVRGREEVVPELGSMTPTLTKSIRDLCSRRRADCEAFYHRPDVLLLGLGCESSDCSEEQNIGDIDFMARRQLQVLVLLTLRVSVRQP